MKNVFTSEEACRGSFGSLGECYHLYTPENFEIIFVTESDFRAGMAIIAICTMLSPTVKVLTFELMSNHLHFFVVASKDDVDDFFEKIKRMLARFFRKEGRFLNWKEFVGQTRPISDINDARNVIAYINRNGFLIDKRYHPFSYPWGANRFYFNPGVVSAASLSEQCLSFRDRRRMTCSHDADGLNDIPIYEDHASPLSFCDIQTGESLFRDSSQYFVKVSKGVETYSKIAGEIGENIYCLDDELYSVICKAAGMKHPGLKLGELPNDAKIEMAKLMKFDYRASNKQIQRFLKISDEVVRALFGSV